MTQNKIQQIYYSECPLAFRFGSYLALFRPMTIAHLVARLYDFSDLHHQTFHRLSITRTLIRELIEYGVDSEQGQNAIRHMNKKHAVLEQDNDAFRYVLSCFFLEPFRWNLHFENKVLSVEQKQLIIDFWCEVGERMQISDLLNSEAEWLAFQNEYESRYMLFSTQGQRLAKLSLYETPRITFPPGICQIIRQTLLATMDDKVRDTLGLEASAISSKLILKVLPWMNNFARPA